MKSAVVISGNLRTFLMPTRDNSNVSLYDLFIRDIVVPNNLDVFIYTDTNDFYFNDIQYYSTSSIEILNNDVFRLHDKIEFITNDLARKIITEQLQIPNTKSIIIENPYNPKEDSKFNLLNNANVDGSSPILLIHQFRKLKAVYNLVKEYEVKHNFHYDVIVKWRFDISNHGKFDLNNYDYSDCDVYVAGDHSPVIYDWHMFGKRTAMDKALSLYNSLGSYLEEGRVYCCDKCRKYGLIKNNCNCGDHFAFEITLAPEYHYFRLFRDNNIRIKNSGYPACPYRYKGIDMNQNSIDNIIKANNIPSVISYSSGNKVSEKSYEDKMDKS